MSYRLRARRRERAPSLCVRAPVRGTLHNLWIQVRCAGPRRILWPSSISRIFGNTVYGTPRRHYCRHMEMRPPPVEPAARTKGPPHRPVEPRQGLQGSIRLHLSPAPMAFVILYCTREANWVAKPKVPEINK